MKSRSVTRKRVTVGAAGTGVLAGVVGLAVLAAYPSRPASAFDLHGAPGPDDEAITEAIRGCLMEADLDTVTKKQGKIVKLPET